MKTASRRSASVRRSVTSEGDGKKLFRPSRATLLMLRSMAVAKDSSSIRRDKIGRAHAVEKSSPNRPPIAPSAARNDLRERPSSTCIAAALEWSDLAYRVYFNQLWGGSQLPGIVQTLMTADPASQATNRTPLAIVLAVALVLP